jgi:hypothetical protein
MFRFCDLVFVGPRLATDQGRLFHERTDAIEARSNALIGQARLNHSTACGTPTFIKGSDNMRLQCESLNVNLLFLLAIIVIRSTRTLKALQTISTGSSSLNGSISSYDSIRPTLRDQPKCGTKPFLV